MHSGATNALHPALLHIPIFLAMGLAKDCTAIFYEHTSGHLAPNLTMSGLQAKGRQTKTRTSMP